MKIALVTGATRGIGLAVAQRLAKDDHHVVVAARDAAGGAEVARRLPAEGYAGGSVPRAGPARAEGRGAASYVADQLGRLDVLVNNAGILPEAGAADADGVVDIALFEQTFATNLFGAVAVSSAFLPLLRTSAAGRIVNVSSTMGSLADQTNPDSPYYPMGVPAYRASKAALNSVTIALSKALADTPIKVTSVCPGWVQTDLAPGAREQAPTTPEAAAEVVVAAATLADDVPSGTFMSTEGTVPW